MKRWIALATVLIVGMMSAIAQDIDPRTPVPSTNNAVITFPPPVYVAGGELPIAGSASVPSMANYFLEFRPLSLEAPQPNTPELAWSPATLPQTTPVRDGILGVWNTNTAPDGIYELRLVVNIQGQAPQFFRVSPIRVLNNPTALSPFAQAQNANTRPPLQATPTAIGGLSASVQATQQAIATALAGNSTGGNSASSPSTSGSPVAIATTDVNVRSGDSVQYGRIGSMLAGEQARIIGISSTGSGWYYVELAGGRRGFVAPSVVRVEGNASNLSRFNPPPVPVTPTPTPLPAQGDLFVNGLRIEPASPTCATEFAVFTNITNTEGVPLKSDANVTISTRHITTGLVTSSITVNIPPLAPGQNWVVSTKFTVSVYYSEEHEIIVTADSDNRNIETNENNNRLTQRYTLQQGGC